MDKPVTKTKKSHKPYFPDKPYFADKYKQRKQGGAIAPPPPPPAYATDKRI